MTEPKINVDAKWFDLKANPTKLETAADKWRTMGTDTDGISDDIHKAGQKVLDGDGEQWKGNTRDTYEAHQKSLVTSMSGTKGNADDVAGALDGLATLLRNRQSDLTTLENKLKGRVANVTNGNQITFSPANPKESKGVKDAVAKAETLRSDLDTQMSTHSNALTKSITEWKAVSTEWKKYAADNAPDTFKLPPEADNGPQSITLPDGTVVFNTGTGDEQTSVRKDHDGNVVVTVDGETFTYPPGTPIAIRGGAGDDSTTIHSAVSSEVSVLGGEGDDEVADNDATRQSQSTGPRTIIGGDGSDRIVVNGEHKNVSTGAGEDEVIALGNHNDVSTGDGKDDVRTTGGYTSTGRSDDFVRAGNHNNELYEDVPVNASTIFGGEGNEEIQGSTKSDKISGGSGNDQIYGHEGSDLISGDSGYDYIDGQDGNDTISGGSEKDTIYGLDGDDTISGGSGRDYLEGAEGNDTLAGGTGEDVVSGGRGDDVMHGGDGDDVMYAGEGKDSLDGGDGHDDAYVQDEDTVASDGMTSSDNDNVEKVDVVDTSFIQVDGSDEFEDRIRADLNMYGSSPTGRQMMENLSDRVSETHHDGWTNPGEREIVIHEFDEENGTANNGGNFSWSDVNININPDFHLSDPGETNSNGTVPVHAYREGVPSTVLYHELAHGYDYLNGTSADGEDKQNDAPNDERQAAGLDYDWDGDGKRDDVHDSDNPHPYAYTENGLREEMGRDHRDAY